MSIKKILAFTSIRSDYDLMSGLYKKIQNDPELRLGLLVAGAHMSETYGYTVKHIENDNLPIIARIESLIDSNSLSSRIKSASILMQNCIHTVEAFKPDVIVYAGDREDVIVAALIGAYFKIPTVHFFGGDHSTDGNVDNPVRHATSKLSTFHFVTHDSHKKRLKKIGETEERIFTIGSPALDKFIRTPWNDKKELLSSFNKEWNEYSLVIYHPILGHEKEAGEYFEEILLALKEKDINAFVSYPNSDPGNKKIIEVIEKYKKDTSFVFYKNLTRGIFINLMRHATFMIGNSSAGLLEAPIIPLGVINIGARQKGRMAAQNVIFVEQGKKNILNGIEQVLSKKFQKELDNVVSPYGFGDSEVKALNLLKTLDFSKFILKSEDPLNV